MRPRPMLLALLLAAVGSGMGRADAAAGVRLGPGTWRVTGGTLTLSLSEAHLETLGLRVTGERVTAVAGPGARALMEPPLYAFAMAPGFEGAVRTKRGGFAGFTRQAPLVFRGGVAFRAENPVTGRALPPAFLYDFSVVVVERADGSRLLEIRTLDPDLPVPLEVRNGAFRFDRPSGTLAVLMGDLVISEAWAERLAQPLLAGQPLGVFDLRLSTSPLATGEALFPENGERGPGGNPIVDVKTGELFGLASLGRVGTYPTGINGLAAATTSCNVGEVNIPWHGPMAEDHPFIGIAMYRESADGILEMIGRNWIKHGFFALSNSDCTPCENPTAGDSLGVGCSDTYSVSNNGSRYYLGPREEVDPYTGLWEACGSFFDATPVDCQRDYYGIEPNAVNHRVEVYDADLLDSTATYYYEGLYVVAGDDDPLNNFGWRQVIPTWLGSLWTFDTIVEDPTWPEKANPGPVVTTWGDQQTRVTVASDDGDVWVAVKVIDLGGGQWHYEYALYNGWSNRGVYSFSVPVGSAAISNVGFHDYDGDPGNDWPGGAGGGLVTWATDDYATNPDAHALFYQTLFNFRFDADQPPAAVTASCGLFKPGVGTTFFADTKGPQTGAAVAVREPGACPEGIALSPGRPNPFSTGTVLSFSLERPRDVRLSVLDVAGRTVRVLVEGRAPAGWTRVPWDGCDGYGSRVASGVYFFRLEAGGERRTVKGTLLR